MLALQLEKQHVKQFMNLLLRGETFDIFEMRTVDIAAHVHTNINGAADFTADAATEQKPHFSTWGSVRQLVYEVIKACGKPRSCKIVLSYPADAVQNIHSNAAALFLNIIYDAGEINITTGTSQREFIYEKTLEATWEDYVRQFFAKEGLHVTDRE